jgi:predicted metal-dependent peptidase
MAAEHQPGGAVHSHRGTPAVQRMVEYAPSTGSLALWIRHRDADGPEAPPLVVNDGSTITYGPAFAELPLSRQTGLVAHEVLHVALRHAPRYLALRRQTGDVDLHLFNICADAIVNSTLSHLGWLELLPGVRLEQLLAEVLGERPGTDQALLEWDLERLYRVMDDRRPPQSASTARGKPGSSGKQGQSESGGEGGAQPREESAQRTGARADGPRSARVRALGQSSLRDLVPDESAERPEAEAEQAREWRERLVRGHAGDGAHSILRALLADLPRVHTPWQQILRTRLAHALSLKRSLSWSRPARSYLANQGRAANGRRMPWEPGFSSAKAIARLVVMVDVSGSIDEPLLNRFASEIEAISRRTEAELRVILGDDQVRSVETFKPGSSNLREIQFQGGGGTDFTPLLEEAARYRPDIAVFLTDLAGPARVRPRFPVIWAVPAAEARRPHPFGRKLVLD